MDMIGNLLYTERMKKGIEIVDAEQATGIRAIYLQALEQGEYEVLPGKVYVKGFIRNYANFLGLDGTKLVHLYSESMAPIDSPPTVTPAPRTRNKSFVVQNPFGKKTISTLAVVIILIVSALSLYMWQKSQPATVSEISRNNLPERSNLGGIPNSPSANFPAVAATPVLPAGSRPVLLVARYSDNCWTSVIADGKTLYEGIPRIDETFTWEADRQIVVNFGNAAAVELTFNGKPVGKIGERGEVVVKTFTSPTAPISSPTSSTPATPPAIAPVLPNTPNTPGTSGSRP